VSPDGIVVAGGSFDGLVRLFETASGRHLATLVGFGDEEWTAVTPEGFAAAGSMWTKASRWRAGPGNDLNSEWVWKAVAQPVQVAKGLAGGKLSEPAFSAPQP
jgi:hypothetical protein